MIMPSSSRLSLRQTLIDSGIVSAEKISQIAPETEDTKLGQALVEQGIITAQQLAMAIKQRINRSSVNLKTCPVQPDAVKIIPESTARRYNVMPLTLNNKVLRVAMSEPDNVLALQSLAAQARVRIEPLLARADEIREAIDRTYKTYTEIGKQLSRVQPSSPRTEIERGVSFDSVSEAPAARTLDLIIKEAVKNRASDIHMEPQKDRVRLRYRIDGVLQDTMSLPLSAHTTLVSRLKILANMNIADHRPQDGQFSFRVGNREVDIRVATIHDTCGEMAVLRILDKSFSALKLTELGFSTDNMKQYENMLKFPFGMILISGPTGSGKTTTLYASVSHLNCKERNIITVEDPVEYRFEDINQIQINPRAGLTFANGLRAILRHDPDIILVGEIRDAETAEIAVQAALTGHLVLSSVHANDSVGALFRLLDLGIAPFLVSSALIGVAAQRMVRRVCLHCQRPTAAPADAQIAYRKEIEEERSEFLYGSGCNACSNTGYLGRTAVFEIMRISEEIRKMIVDGASSSQIQALARSEGTTSMWHDGMLKVKAGITTPDEVLRSVFTSG